MRRGGVIGPAFSRPGYYCPVTFNYRIVESRISEAMAAGSFSNLPGEGQPLPEHPEEQLAGENWLGFKLLRDAGELPPWLQLARQIEEDRQALEALDARHAALVRAASRTGDWERLAPALRALAREYREAALALRRKQDRFNLEAPAIHLERPGIWVEHHLQKLVLRLREAGAPPELCTV